MDSNGEVRENTGTFIRDLHKGVRYLVGDAIGASVEDGIWAAITRRWDPVQTWNDANLLEFGRIATEAYWLTLATSSHEPHVPISYPEAEEVRYADVRVYFSQRSRARGAKTPPFILHDPLQADTIVQDDVLAVAVASEAAQHNFTVRGFRKRFLDNNLVPLDQIGNWVEDQALSAGQFTVWAEAIPLPSGKTVEVLQNPTSVQVPSIPGNQGWWHHFRVRWLRYWEIGKPIGGESMMPTAHGSTLERLRWDSHKVAVEFGWTEAQAATFILTGSAPRQQQIRWGFLDHDEMRALSRIIMTVDPIMSPREVAEQYRIAREVAIGRDRRPREIDEKHLHLALVGIQKNTDRTWRAVLKEWNERWQCARSDWVYKDLWNFSRDCTRARKRLLGLSETSVPGVDEEERWDNDEN